MQQPEREPPQASVKISRWGRRPRESMNWKPICEVPPPPPPHPDKTQNRSREHPQETYTHTLMHTTGSNLDAQSSSRLFSKMRSIMKECTTASVYLLYKSKRWAVPSQKMRTATVVDVDSVAASRCAGWRWSALQSALSLDEHLFKRRLSIGSRYTLSWLLTNGPPLARGGRGRRRWAAPTGPEASSLCCWLLLSGGA